jgi:hypothetical protein
MNGDGHLDIIAALSGINTLRIYLNDGGTTPSFTSRSVATFSGVWSAEAVDIDGDGNLDLVAAGNGADEYAWWHSDGGDPPSFTKYVLSSTPDAPKSVIYGDLDNDGDIDIVGGTWTGGDLRWYENLRPSPSSEPSGQPSSQPTSTSVPTPSPTLVPTTAPTRAAAAPAAEESDDWEQWSFFPHGVTVLGAGVVCLVASGLGALAYHRHQERQEEKETHRQMPAAPALASVLPEECLADEIEARRLRAVKGLPPGAVIPAPPPRARSGKERSSSIRSKGELGQHYGDVHHLY